MPRTHRDTRAPSTVLVTGASSGIGRATALELARRGTRLVLVSRSEQTLAEVAAECRREGAEARCVAADVADAAAVTAAFDYARSAYGPVDGVVHAAAVLALGRFEDVPVEDFDRVLTVNVSGTAHVARAALDHFREAGGGSLVVVGSLLGRTTTPYLSGYVASKWAVHGLVRTLQIEARRTPGVRIGLVTPGGVDTPIYDAAAHYVRRAGRPPPPVESPERVARAVVRSLSKPRRNASVGPANGITALGFRLLPGVYDRVITPYMDVALLSRDEADERPGNLWRPVPAVESVHGRWGRHWLRLVGGGAVALAATGAARRTIRRKG